MFTRNDTGSLTPQSLPPPVSPLPSSSTALKGNIWSAVDIRNIIIMNWSGEDSAWKPQPNEPPAPHCAKAPSPELAGPGMVETTGKPLLPAARQLSGQIGSCNVWAPTRMQRKMRELTTGRFLPNCVTGERRNSKPEVGEWVCFYKKPVDGEKKNLRRI